MYFYLVLFEDMTATGGKMNYYNSVLCVQSKDIRLVTILLCIFLGPILLSYVIVVFMIAQSTIVLGT